MKYINELVTVQIDWWPSFAVFPHRTITGQWIWFRKCYKRIVWRYTGMHEEPFYTGMHEEPFTEYATMFDILAAAE